jgi:DHA1 family bicyclomycin/chloramphenicol resistance-like MFS transporter
MELYKVTAQQYGWIFATIAGGLITSSQLNTYLLSRGLKSEQIVVGALICQSLTGIIFLVATLNGWLGALSTVGFIFAFLCCQGFIFPNTSALSLAPFTRNAGSASALMGGIQMSIGAFASAMVSWMNNHSAIPMTAVMATCAVSSFTILMIGSRIVRYRAELEEVEEECAEMAKTV